MLGQQLLTHLKVGGPFCRFFERVLLTLLELATFLLELPAFVLQTQATLCDLDGALLKLLRALAVAQPAVGGVLLVQPHLLLTLGQLDLRFLDVLLHGRQAIASVLIVVVELAAHVRHLLAHLGQLRLLLFDEGGSFVQELLPFAHLRLELGQARGDSQHLLALVFELTGTFRQLLLALVQLLLELGLFCLLLLDEGGPFFQELLPFADLSSSSARRGAMVSICLRWCSS